ncbi:hypothetical protein Dimus_021058 [Dionaea muscipula]
MDPRQFHHRVSAHGDDDEQQQQEEEEEDKIRNKHHILLKEFLSLQKEYVSRKRKLRESCKKKELLLSQVRFLRARCKFLLKNQETVCPQIPHGKSKDRYFGFDLTSLGNSYPDHPENPNPNPNPNPSNKRKVGMEPVRVAKMKTNYLFNKKVDRKISSQDQLAL